MAKLTLIDIVQDILSAMVSDSVNSITDTTESQQVVRIIHRVYRDIIATRYWPNLKKLTRLTGMGDSSLPTTFRMRDTVQKLEDLRYDVAGAGETRKKYTKIIYMDPSPFLTMTNGRNSDNANVDVVQDIDGRDLLIINDKRPRYYTSFDDEHIVMDAYDNQVESTLQQHKIQALAYEEPLWVEEDTYVPDLPSKAFQYLEAESMSVAFNEIRQAPNGQAAQTARRLRTWLAQQKLRQNSKLRQPNYGRTKRNHNTHIHGNDSENS